MTLVISTTISCHFSMIGINSLYSLYILRKAELWRKVINNFTVSVGFWNNNSNTMQLSVQAFDSRNRSCFLERVNLSHSQTRWIRILRVYCPTLHCWPLNSRWIFYLNTGEQAEQDWRQFGTNSTLNFLDVGCQGVLGAWCAHASSAIGG